MLTTVFECEKRMVCGQWFRCGHIQAGSSNPTGGQGFIQILLIDHSPSLQ